VTTGKDSSKDASDATSAVEPAGSSSMSESSAVPAASARAKGPAKAHWAASLALILAILGVGLSVYTWYVTQIAGQLEAGRELGRLDGVDRELTRLVSEQSGLQARIDTALSQNLEDKREVLESIDAAQSELDARFKSLADEQAGAFARQNDEISSLAGTLAATRTQLGSVEEDWTLREVAHLLLLANQRLTLLGDTELAKRALTLADDRLRSVADPGILEVRRVLSQELSALERVQLPDISGIALDLSSLVQTVSALPLKGDGDRPDWIADAHADQSGKDSSTASSVDKDKAGFFTALMSRLADDLGSLIRVRRVDETQPPKLDNSERFLAFENLRLHLLVAQLAVLRSDQAVYEENLTTARVWLDDYFESSSESQGFDARLLELMQIDIVQELPDISESLTLLRSQIDARTSTE